MKRSRVTVSQTRCCQETQAAYRNVAVQTRRHFTLPSGFVQGEMFGRDDKLDLKYVARGNSLLISAVLKQLTV